MQQPFPRPSARLPGTGPRRLATLSLAGAVFVGTATAAASQDRAATLPEAPQTMLILPAEALRDFRPLVASSPNGPNIVAIEGDPYATPSITLFRYTHNYAGSRRLHTHTHTYRSILIEGEMKHWGAEGSEETATILRPGAYWRQPGGQLHADHCVTDHCLTMVIFEGEIDAHFDGAHP